MYFILLGWCFVSRVVLAVPDHQGCENMKVASNDWETEYRLPASVQPLHYDLYLHPNLETDTFSGHVNITLEISQARNYVNLHVKNLSVTHTKLFSVTHNDAEEVVPLSEAFEYEPNQFWVVKLDGKDSLRPGTYKLYLEFNGRLDNGILGFYKSVYTDEQGQAHKMATSKFQPTYARQAFPCFDEPSFKSNYTTTLVKPSDTNYVALSNMPMTKSKVDKPLEGLTEVTFQTTVPMVTYLAIFIVSDFEFIETVTQEHGIPLKVYGTHQQIPRLDYALRAGAAIADFYETYFGIRYPLPKLDMAAIPDYSSGATEHWGLITYRETNLVYDPEESSVFNKERVAMVIAHELAHQWFGNLITVHWWNDLWLNEGFATYIEYKGVQSFEIDWDMEAKFLSGDLHPVLQLDATVASHPIVVDVDTPDQINAVFDMIAYNKGASVIRMMEDFMGPADFRSGLTAFLLKYSYKTAITEDLLRELSAASTQNLNMSQIMGTWTRQKGFPVIVIGKSDGGYTLRQERFLTSNSSSEDVTSPYDYKWEVPVSYLTSENPQVVQRNWLHLDDTSLFIRDGGCDWIKFNVNQKGYYRVQYPAEEWNKFAQLLQANIHLFSSSDRTSLLNDAFSLASAGRIAYESALNLTLYLSNETAVAPWETAFSALDNMADVLYFTPIYPGMRQFLENLVAPLYKQLSWTEDAGESIEVAKLRSLILKKMCSYGNAEALQKAQDILLSYRQTGGKIAPNLRDIVYVHGMQGFDTWKWMLDLYKVENNAQEKLKLLRGLCSSGQPWILSHLLDLAWDESIVRRQDYFTLITYMSWNRIGEPIVWDFVRNNWPRLVQRFTLNDRLMGRMLSDIVKKFATPQRLQEMEDFYAAYPEAGAGKNYRKIALETVKGNIDFLSTYANDIGNWLLNQK